MVLTPHILIGAAIGAKIRNPFLISALGILSHLILDKIPHWDYHNKGISDFHESKNAKNLIIDLIKIGCDGLIGISLSFLFLYQSGVIFQAEKLIDVGLGIIMATLPDFFLGAAILFFPQKLGEKFITIHSKFLHCKKEGYRFTFLNLATGFFVIILSVILFFV